MDNSTITEKQRSTRQNKALHKYFGMVAHELENLGMTMQDVVKKISFTEITPTTQSVKEIIWRPIQETVVSKKSTTELTTAEVNQIYEIMSMFLSKQFEISLPFPSEEDTPNYLQSLEQ